MIIPAAGNRNGSDVNNVGNNGNYWSSTPNDSDNANNLNFNANDVNMNNNGQSVRLATELILIVSITDYIAFSFSFPKY